MEIEAHKRDLNPVVRYEMAKTVKKKKEKTVESFFEGGKWSFVKREPERDIRYTLIFSISPRLHMSQDTVCPAEFEKV